MDATRKLIEAVGEDVDREGLKETPARVAAAYGTLLRGYEQDPKDILSRTFKDKSYDQMVFLKDIEFFSLCEHHLIPFFGRAHIAYIPTDGKVVGISKLARLVDCFACRFQIQERMTVQIADAIVKSLSPHTAVTVEAVHLCMRARGVGKQNSVMRTQAIRGVFEEDAVRVEYLQALPPSLSL